MPQNLKKISPEYAKSFYGFVVDPALPFRKNTDSTPEEPDSRFKLTTSGGTVPPLIPEIQPDQEPTPTTQSAPQRWNTSPARPARSRSTKKPNF
jgi:hypothetical protein